MEAPELSGNVPLRAFWHAQVRRGQFGGKEYRLIARQQGRYQLGLPGVGGDRAVCAGRAIRIGNQLLGRRTLVLISSLGAGIGRMMLVLMMPEVLDRLARLMQAIRARHAPAQLEGKGNDQHVDDFFEHGINYKLLQ